jgi:large subunit ribosomal protein L14e
MIEIGRICIKLAGRDAGREAVIVDILEDNYVLIDGNVRRRKCNILHLEPTSQKIEIKKGGSHETIKKELSKLSIAVWETKPKEKKEKPKKSRKNIEVQQPEAKKKGEKVEKPGSKKPIDARVVSVTKKAQTKKKAAKKPVKKK